MYVGAFHGGAGSAVFEIDGGVKFLDQGSGKVIVASEGGCCEFGADGVVLAEPERVRAFDYTQQEIAWTLSSVSESLRGSLIDRGVIVIDTDGTVRLYQ